MWDVTAQRPSGRLANWDDRWTEGEKPGDPSLDSQAGGRSGGRSALALPPHYDSAKAAPANPPIVTTAWSPNRGEVLSPRA